MGHALNGAIQDALTRRARMKGYEALWLPGVDHASIALQNVVERKIVREEGETRWDLGREEFVERCRRLRRGGALPDTRTAQAAGASADWRRLRYTMDEEYIDSVLTAFVELYDAGLIYRGSRITNWCPFDRSAISDLEVNYEETDGKLYGLRYPFVDGRALGPTATATPRSSRPGPRPCSATSPSSSTRMTSGTPDLVGRRVMVPFVEREIEVFADEYVDPLFGTGVLKVTPAHDPNDFEIGDGSASTGQHPQPGRHDQRAAAPSRG